MPERLWRGAGCRGGGEIKRSGEGNPQFSHTVYLTLAWVLLLGAVSCSAGGDSGPGERLGRTQAAGGPTSQTLQFKAVELPPDQQF